MVEALRDRLLGRVKSIVKNLKFDLLSVSKLCDNGRNKITFYTREMFVKDLKTKDVIIKGN